MELIQYGDGAKFYQDTIELLLRQEANHNLFLSNVIRAKNTGGDTFYMASVTDHTGAVLLAGIVTPPYSLVLFEPDKAPEEALTLLARDLVEKKIAFPGVNAEKTIARRFLDIFESLSDRNSRQHQTMIVMVATKVSEFEKPSGQLRLATEEDLFFLPYWNREFAVDCNIERYPYENYYESLRSGIEQKAIYLWEDRFPVSLAKKGREIVTGAVASLVYTPHFYRGKGYASACVGELTKLLLENHSFCCLFVNAENPASNRVYTKIGYEYGTVCEQHYFIE